MPESEREFNRIADEVIRLTTWSNIKRYNILTGIAFVILDLIITLTVVILVANATREADRTRAIKACINTAKLASIERTTVEQNKKNTDNLSKQGETLGLTPKRFKELITQSRIQQNEHLAALNRLVKADCENI